MKAWGALNIQPIFPEGHLCSSDVTQEDGELHQKLLEGKKKFPQINSA